MHALPLDITVRDVLGFQNFAYISSEGLSEKLDGDFADTWADYFELVSMDQGLPSGTAKIYI